MKTRRIKRRGSALLIVMWALVLLSVAVTSVLHTTHIDLHVVKNQGDQTQAYYLAIAGVEKAKALIYREQEDLHRQQLAWV